MKALTSRQRELLGHIAGAISLGRTPLIADLIRQMKVARESGLTDLLRPLEKKGFITVEGGVRGRQRVLDLTPRGKVECGIGLPILGRIPAGVVREAVQDTSEVAETLGDLLPHRAGDFLLEVEGDSMSGDGIFAGDRVLLRPGVDARNGEIAAVQLTHDADCYRATLKHVFFHGDTVCLRASNPAYEDVEVPAQSVNIVGVFRGLVRSSRGS